MSNIRVCFLWHMHQPFYKDLVTGEYRLPWVRMHGLKDYYGMVKLLEEFPNVRQTFNLVPSLMMQLEDYVAGTARDPFLEVALKPASDLSQVERRFALTYLFQANPVHLIGRYPRYHELWMRFTGAGQNPQRAEQYFQTQDYTDLQVLSQLAWFDEFYQNYAEVAALVKKGHSYSAADQKLIGDCQRKILGSILPAYAEAAKKKRIEISTTPFYHPILPLVCDTDQGGVSSPGLPLPRNRYRRPEDAREQLRRALDMHEKVFGARPKGVWPSEGSVSEEVLAIAHELGVEWMATDEGVLGRSLNWHFDRGTENKLSAESAEKLYTAYQYRKGKTNMNLVFRDHSLSDLIGFVYSGMPAKDAAEHFIRTIKESAQPVVKKNKVALVPIILDGENAWEFYPESGREFLRRVYDGLQSDPQIEALSIGEAVAKQKEFGKLESLVPGSWIFANFNVWIGAPEDNRAWDYLFDAREFYEHNAEKAPEEKRKLAFEELLIGEGSDWNWWYGPEHHSANDRDFDELFRKHLSNVYQALGAEVPVHLAQPIATGVARPSYQPQLAYIRPKVGSGLPRYFDWIGAAAYTADRHSGAMHGKQFVLDAVYAGIDEENLYGRLDFTGGGIPSEPLQVAVDFELQSPQRSADVVERKTSKGNNSGKKSGDPAQTAPRTWRLLADLDGGLKNWALRDGNAGKTAPAYSSRQPGNLLVALRDRFEFKVPLAEFGAEHGAALLVRFSVWKEGLPIDALPLEGAMKLEITGEEEMELNIYR